MRLHATALLAILASASAAAGQSCWPVSWTLALRDSAGRPMPPVMVDSVETFHAHRGVMTPRPVRAPHQRASRLSSGSALEWSLAGCRLQLDSVRLTAGGRTMTLVLGLRLDSEQRRGPSALFYEAPPFRAGRYLLRWDPMKPADHPPRLQPASRYWTRIE